MTRTLLHIEGMTCDHCARHVTEALEEVAGVEAVKVSLRLATAVVDHDPVSAPIDLLCRAVEDAGYRPHSD